MNPQTRSLEMDLLPLAPIRGTSEAMLTCFIFVDTNKIYNEFIVKNFFDNEFIVKKKTNNEFIVKKSLQNFL